MLTGYAVLTQVLLLMATHCELISYLVAPESVHHGHADEVEQHTQALEGDNGETEDAILLCQARRIVPAEHTAILTRQTSSWHVREFCPDITIPLRF